MDVSYKEHSSKKTVMIVIFIITLMLCETGATYAYFALSATSTNSLSGTAASSSLEFKNASGDTVTTPSLIAPSNNNYVDNMMVPQLSLSSGVNILQSAFNGASGKDNCVDANNNIICKAYTFTIRNSGSASAVIKGQVQFTWGSQDIYTNLKWKLMDSANQVTVTSSDAGVVAVKDTWQNFITGLSLAPREARQFWMIVWIEETESSQNDTDKGTWNASIQFINNTDNSGITSTITS